jgi:hypothetical protein
MWRNSSLQQKYLLFFFFLTNVFFSFFFFFFFFFCCCDFGVGSCGISHVLSPKCQCIIINSPLLEWQGNTHKIIAWHSQHKKTENNPTKQTKSSHFSLCKNRHVRFETWDLRSNLKHEIWEVLLDLDFIRLPIGEKKNRVCLFFFLNGHTCIHSFIHVLSFLKKDLNS